MNLSLRQFLDPTLTEQIQQVLQQTNLAPQDLELEITESMTADPVWTAEVLQHLKAIITMGHALKLSVIAKGVETAEQLHLLQKHACDEVQGYFYCKPLSAEEIERVLVAACDATA